MKEKYAGEIRSEPHRLRKKKKSHQDQPFGSGSGENTKCRQRQSPLGTDVPRGTCSSDVSRPPAPAVQSRQGHSTIFLMSVQRLFPKGPISPTEKPSRAILMCVCHGHLAGDGAWGSRTATQAFPILRSGQRDLNSVPLKGRGVQSHGGKFRPSGSRPKRKCRGL